MRTFKFPYLILSDDASESAQAPSSLNIIAGILQLVYKENKGISTHPGASSAVDPLNEVVKDASLQRQRPLYGGVIEAFRNGKLPSNAQIDEALQYVVNKSPVVMESISPEGKKLIYDVQKIIKTARVLVQDKNANELFQDFMYRIRGTDCLELEGAVPVEINQEDNAFKHLRSLLELILTNSEVRKFITDFSVIGRDQLSRGATKMAGTIGLSDERFRNVNQSASNSDSPLGDKQKGVRSGVSQTGDIVLDNLHRLIPKDKKAKDDHEGDRHSLTDEYVSEERRDQFIFRGKKVITEIQKHNNYRQSINWLLNYIEQYVQHRCTTAEAGRRQTESFTKDSEFNCAIVELRTLLERFADGYSTKPIFDSADALISVSQKDPSLSSWFNSVNLYIRKVLFEPSYVLESDSDNQAKSLSDRGGIFYNQQYKSHFDGLFNSIGEWFRFMSEDPLNKQFGEDWARLTKDLLFNSEGSFTFKATLWNDLRTLIVPILAFDIGYIPIPRIEYNDDRLDLVVENLTLQGRNFLPKFVRLEASEIAEFSFYKIILDEHHHRIKLTLKQMHAELHDVVFKFHLKTGFVRLKDSGIADVLLGGEGLSAIIELHPMTRDRSSVFKVHNIQVKVEDLTCSIHGSKHDLLYQWLRPLVTKLIQRQIETVIKATLTTGLEYIDGQLVAARDRMEIAKAVECQSRSEDLTYLDKVKGTTKLAGSESQFKESILAKERVNQGPEVNNRKWGSDAFSRTSYGGDGDVDLRH